MLQIVSVRFSAVVWVATFAGQLKVQALVLWAVSCLVRALIVCCAMLRSPGGWCYLLRRPCFCGSSPRPIWLGALSGRRVLGWMQMIWWKIIWRQALLLPIASFLTWWQVWCGSSLVSTSMQQQTAPNSCNSRLRLHAQMCFGWGWERS